MIKNEQEQKLYELAMSVGAWTFTPPPLRAITGVSMTFTQLKEYTDLAVAQKKSTLVSLIEEKIAGMTPSECAQFMRDSAALAQQEPEPEPVSPDGDEKWWEADFEGWWESDGQYCRAGGGQYEKSFARAAWAAAKGGAA